MGANRHDIKVLNNLIEALLDSAAGYHEAAEKVEDGREVRWLQNQAADRLELVEYMQAQVKMLGSSGPEDSGSILQKAGRAFSGFAQAILGSSQSLKEMLNSADDRLVALFESAIEDKDISATTRELIRRGRENIVSSRSASVEEAVPSPGDFADNGSI